MQCVVIDSNDPPSLARFWAATMHWRVTYENDHESVVEPQEDSGLCDVVPDLLFVLSREEKMTKNRLHFDLRPEDQAAEVDRLLDLGAQRVDIGQGESRWVVLADPEGNEFCVLPPLPQEDAQA